MDQRITTILLICLLLLVPTLGYFGYYLAVGSDQYEVIRFAQDLASGSLFRDHPVFNLIKDRTEPEQLYSIHYGGYLLRNGRIFCKYAIGYPLILAVFIVLFGLPGAFFANFFIYSALLLVIYLLGTLYFTGHPAARQLALGASLLFFLLIKQVWKLSATPHGDVASLLFLTAGVYFLVLAFRGKKSPSFRYVALAGLLLGYSAVIRTPNILMVLPAGLYFLARICKGTRPVKSAAVIIVVVIAIVVGVSPALYQNYSVNGSIFKPPQWHEIHLETVTETVGDPGGLALSGLPQRVWEILTRRTSGWGIGNIHAAIWPMMFHLLVTYGPLFGLLFIVGLVRGWKRPETRLLFFPVIATYLVFYSGWVRPLERYIIPLYPFMTIIIMGPIGSLISSGDRAGSSGLRRSAVFLGTAAAAGLIAVDFIFRSLNPRYPRRFAWDVHLQYPAVLLVALILLFLWHRRAVRKNLRPALLIFNVTVMAAILIVSSPILTYKGKLFQFSEARRLRRDLDDVLQPPSILFATKFLSQSLDLFTASYSLRPSDLEQFIPDYGTAYDLLMWKGFNLYLINNRGKRNASAYIPYIRDYFTVSPVVRLPADRYHLEDKFGRPVCTVYSIKRWKDKEVILDLATPEAIDYLLTVNFYKLWDSLPRRKWVKVLLFGKELPEEIDNDVNYLHLAAADHPRPRSLVRFTSDQGLPEDIFLGLQWLNRDYLIRLGPLAFPPDRFFLSEAFYYYRVFKVNWRKLNHPGSIRIPTPLSPCRLLTAEFSLRSRGDRDESGGWEVFLNGQPAGALPVRPEPGWQSVRIELPLEGVDRSLSLLELRPDRERPAPLLIGTLRIARWFSEVEIPTPAPGPYLLKAGVYFPGATGEAVLELNGKMLRTVKGPGPAWDVLMPEDISRPLSHLRLASGENDALFHVSVLQPLSYPLTIDIGTAQDEEFMDTGFFPAEMHLEQTPVCWTEPRATVFIPFTKSGEKDLVLSIGYFGVRPGEAQPAPVEVRLDGELLGEFQIETGKKRVELSIPPEKVRSGVSRLELVVRPWRPSDFLPVKDSRELGMMLDYVGIAKRTP